MVHSRLFAAYPPAALDAFKSKDIERRLNLYQVFLKLYEHNPGLLNEILSLENSNSQAWTVTVPQFIQGMIGEPQTCLIANVGTGSTQMLWQPQHIWLIGRDRTCAITINDQRISRRHAVIQYLADAQRFYLIDLNSSNGSYVNGEPIRHRHPLQDGDRIRLGSLAFTFFVCQACQPLEDISPEILSLIEQAASIAPEKPGTPNPAPILPPPAQDTSKFLLNQKSGNA
ncbi:FHA domain-containing protein [Desertifilum sp. FACHB-1129]|uniref:FHA domain-containing protein n=1 Tax=Desertifilum tharense IPPAS B-1220 TaxID=1781255 RepID=A0A1E5QDK3_9CYAN|nr:MULTISPECIES: FHA domain-containing protein [Desertifilum]MCD8486595.1 FHA domain-containing protein [Desertifilum sp.]MDA0212021.1 FHA domain-containing protein [Cyanobacteria bacterium FC1]MBD2315097.1 FHA domain-containing protein [Desertifilum sp. FACHB-1129]MBD2324921.1 FHA domain-containing protein [Desertifilum sp. FACHB-866]MBD2335014.1 FHA domain-containing protein [Desertifilum sp. FACHB-868]